MFTTVRKSILARKWRLASTTISIVLGVAFISGTYILTDTMRSAFEDVFASTTAGIDVAVRATNEFSSQITPTDSSLIPQAVLEDVAAVDGVRVASGEVTGAAVIIDQSGEVASSGGAPSLATNAPMDEQLSSATLREGAFPTLPDEVAVDAATVEAQGLAIGDDVSLVVSGPVETYRLSGIVGFGEVDNLGGATFVMFENGRATELFGQDGFSELYIAAEDGADINALITTIELAVGDEYEVLTGDELAASVTADINEGLQFFTTALLVFAGVSLFVGSFLIANTFTIVVAQRTRELALLRAVGASRLQVVGSVLTEAFVVGVVGSAVGLLLGFGVAEGLQFLLPQFGIDLPQGTTVFATRTVVVSILVGLGVTMAAALLPAIRSTRVAPVAALQAVAAPPARRQSVWRNIIGGVLFAGGVALLAQGLWGGGGIRFVGAGAVVTLFGAAALSSLVTTPILSAIGAPLTATRGIAGTLAKQNAIRSPRRTAATASALMIGLALVSFTFILGASVERSALAGIDEAFLAEFQIDGAGQAGPPGASSIPPSVIDQVEAVDGVAVATPLTLGGFLVGDVVELLAGVDPEEIPQALSLTFIDGSWADLAEGGIMLSQDSAERQEVGIGDNVLVTFNETGEQRIPVAAIFNGDRLDVDWVVSDTLYEENYAQPDIVTVYVDIEDGADLDDVRGELDQAVAGFPTVQVQDLDEVKADLSRQVNQLLGLLSAMLGLSVLIALFGIVNTLGLSVLERTRELGLLRAVGATRSQIRSMVRWESILIAVLGALLGIMVGAVFGWMVVEALSDQGITDFVVPSGQLIASVLGAALAGVLAAILPARRAARTDILRALEAQ